MANNLFRVFTSMLEICEPPIPRRQPAYPCRNLSWSAVNCSIPHYWPTDQLTPGMTTATPIQERPFVSEAVVVFALSREPVENSWLRKVIPNVGG
ncbi:hypothetical protein [Mycobacterium lepromatosis]|uniref:hypothetical protein n=1 Tax=Mycobacterium lepromatosis TaxID=480418 RepID=UPI000679A51C|nr:hypothetical protein [Mycobacterium lepromatosis]